MVRTALDTVNLNGSIEHTYLKASCTPEDIDVLCQEAMTHQFYSVCIPPYFVFQARSILGSNSAVKICTVVGYPLGYNSTGAKVEEIKRAIMDGVDELDVVVNISAIKAGDWNFVKNDIESTTMMAHLKGKKIKVVFESSELEADELKKLCEICKIVGVNYIVPGTGFSQLSSTPEQIEYIRSIVDPSIKIKAEGRFKTKLEAKQIISAGANKLGTTTGIRLMSSV